LHHFSTHFCLTGAPAARVALLLDDPRGGEREKEVLPQGQGEEKGPHNPRCRDREELHCPRCRRGGGTALTQEVDEHLARRCSAPWAWRPRRAPSGGHVGAEALEAGEGGVVQGVARVQVRVPQHEQPHPARRGGQGGQEHQRPWPGPARPGHGGGMVS